MKLFWSSRKLLEGSGAPKSSGKKNGRERDEGPLTKTQADMETQVNNLNGTNQQIVQKTTAINSLATTYEPSFAASALALTLESLVTSKLSTNTRQAYEQDARQFVAWLDETGLSLKGLTLTDMKQYRRYVSDKFAPASAAR